MKKFLVAGVALVLALALASVAIAANQYTVTGKVTPTKSGTSKKAVPIGMVYGFTTRDDADPNRRPASLATLKVKFGGIRFNGNNFPGCSAAAIEAAKSADNCPARSLVATGYARNYAGAVADRSDRSIRCYLKVSLYNSRNNKAALFVENGQSTDPSRDDYCPALGLATAIPVTTRNTKAGGELSFTIPSNLQNPVATLKNSLVETKLTVRKLTTKVKGKTRGFVETYGGCTKRKRTITTTFTHEDGTSKKVAKFACKK